MRVTYFILIFASEKTKTIIINLQNKTIMKKIFTLIAIAMMAVGAQAQTYSITFSEVAAKGSLDGKTFGSDGFILTCTDPNKEKLQVDANNCYFGTAEEYDQYSFRLKTNGKSSSNNKLTLSTPKAGTLTIAVRTATSSDETRTVVLKQDGTELYNQVLKDADAVEVEIEGEAKKVYPYISVEVAAGTIDITYPVNGVNFYAFILEAGTPTGIENVQVAENENAPMYNLAGQQVDKNFKGVVIQNGKKFINK